MLELEVVCKNELGVHISTESILTFDMVFVNIA